MAEIKITADTSQAEREIKRLEKALEGIDNVADGAATALAAITAAAAAMGYAILKTLDSAGELIDVSKALGISAANLQQLQSAAAMAGVGADQLNSSLIRLSGNLGSALQKGSGPAIDALNKLNIPLREIATSRPDEQFKRIATELNKISSPAERNAMAIELFGKQGPRLLDVANNLERVKKTLTDADFTALDEAGDAIDLLKAEFDVGLKKAVADIAPYIINIVNKIREAVKEAGGFEAIFQKIKDAIKLALNIAIFTAVIAALARMLSFAVALRIAILEAGFAMGLFNTIVKRNPLMLAVGAALVLAKVLGLDVVGAMDQYLGLSEGVDDVKAEILQKTEENAAATNETLEYTQQITEEQQKALKALDDTIGKIQLATQYERDRVTLGEDQANINKIIYEEQSKLEKVGLSLTDTQRERIQLAQEELIAAKEQAEIAKVIYDATRKQTELEKINRGLGLQKSLGGATGTGFVTSEKEYQRDQEALQALLDNKIISEQQYFQQREELARQYNQKVQDLEMARIQTVMMAETSGLATVLSERDKGIIQAVGQQERQRKIVQERIEFEKKSEVEKAQLAIQQGANIFSALGAQNKKAFEAAKAFNIANAIMNTYLGVTKALAVYPFPFNLVFAAGALAAGMAQVAQIRSQSYSGRALGGPVMGGQTYMVGESGPELFTPNTTGSITRNGDLPGGGPVNVQFTIVANDTQGFDALLASRKGVIQQIISDAMLERGQRSTM